MTMASNEVELYHRAPLDQRMTYAQAIVSAGRLLPRGIDNPGAVLLMMETADMLGLHPMAGLQGIHIIEGKPSISANLMAALIRKAGHKLRVRIEGSGDTMKAVAELIRHDDPDYKFRAEFSHEDAKTAGLLGKDVWKKYERGMLKSRAISEVAREGANDALLGAIYTPEELGGEVDDQGELVSAPVQSNPKNVTPETTESSEIGHSPDEISDEARATWFSVADNTKGVEPLQNLYREIRAKGLLGVTHPTDPEVTLGEYVVALGKAAAAAAESGADPETGEVDDEGESDRPAVLDDEVIDAEVVDDDAAESPAEPPKKTPAARRTRKPANAPDAGAEQG